MLKRNMISTAGCLLLFAASLLTGCSGGGGGGSTTAPSQPVVDAATMSNETLSAVSLQASDIKVTINSPPVVTFKLLTAAGNPIKGLGVKSSSTPTNLNYLNFTIAKLVPATNGGSDQWQNYIVTSTSGPTRERVAANLVDNGDGSYTYTFAKNITDPTQTNGVTYEPNKTHRLVIQISGTIPGTSIALANPANIIYDFVPDGSKVTATKEVTLIAKCNECHDKLAFHGGGRVDTRYCVVCHTDQRRIGQTNVASVNGVFPSAANIADGEVQGDFAVMVHKIHMGNRLTKTGYDYAGVKYNELGYSMLAVGTDAGQKNCLKCHVKSSAAPQGDNWKAKPSRAACGSCHDNLNFATGANSKAGKPAHIIQTTDTNCATCHTEVNVTDKHATQHNSPNSPKQIAGMQNFEYEIKNVAVNNDNQPVVTFRILKNGSPVTTLPLTGYSFSTSFIVAYAMPQSGIAAPADYNNFGNKNTNAGQPNSVSLTNLLNATQGTISQADASGYFTATLTGTTAAPATYPAGATMRTIAMQGQITQQAGTEGIAANSTRYVRGVVKAATGDTPRRAVVDSDKCFKCHDILVFHGGSRVYNAQLCATCHNPNLSSSTQTIDPAAMSAAEKALLAADGYSTTDKTNWPEASNNLKDMLHGIHAGKLRAAAGSPFRFMRNQSGGRYFSFDKIGFPGLLQNCESCHLPGTYNSAPTNALPSTNIILGSGTVAQNRANAPNTDDKVIPAYTASCLSCHGSSNAAVHSISMGSTNLNGVARSAATADSCTACHSSGKAVDAATVHRR